MGSIPITRSSSLTGSDDLGHCRQGVLQVLSVEGASAAMYLPPALVGRGDEQRARRIDARTARLQSWAHLP